MVPSITFQALLTSNTKQMTAERSVLTDVFERSHQDTGQREQLRNVDHDCYGIPQVMKIIIKFYESYGFISEDSTKQTIEYVTGWLDLDVFDKEDVEDFGCELASRFSSSCLLLILTQECRFICLM